MPLLAGHRNFAAAVSALSAASCVAVLSACSSPQEPSTSKGSEPPVWTGTPAASSSQPGKPAPAAHPAHPSAEPAPGNQSITAHLKGRDGVEVAMAMFEFTNSYATVTIITTGNQLTPGFHGVHIHKVRKCEPDSVAPGSNGPKGDFLSAGGHFQGQGHAAHGSSGDLTSLQVRKDGSGTLVTTTDTFTMADLTAGEGTAIIIHAGADNFANIPPKRYSQINGGATGPDEQTMSTGDAGDRVACGEIGAG